MVKVEKHVYQILDDSGDVIDTLSLTDSEAVSLESQLPIGWIIGRIDGEEE